MFQTATAELWLSPQETGSEGTSVLPEDSTAKQGHNDPGTRVNEIVNVRVKLLAQSPAYTGSLVNMATIYIFRTLSLPWNLTIFACFHPFLLL